ncbi:MAG TPA: TIR domain-containing protein [Casimicrobiaceae bacterium]|nr:TIR domain-containing protein [Casimicrobiaceae bacterium]
MHDLATQRWIDVAPQPDILFARGEIQRMGHIFISYSRRDSQFVDHLVQALELYGFSTWEDVKAIAGGDVWKAAISKAVRECDAFLLVLSPQSAESDNVGKELAVATKHARRILPVMYQACKVPDKMEYDLAELHWAEFHDKPFDEAFENLVRALGGKPSVDLASSQQVQALRAFVESQLGRLVDHIAPAVAPILPTTPSASVSRPPPALMEFCIQCGTRLVRGNAFCINCGTRISGAT